MHGDSTSGLLTALDAWIFLGAWLVVALGYAVWRSLGDAKPDPIRPSGPGV